MTKTTSLGDALFTKTQQRVLGLLYGKPDQSFYTNDIVRRVGMGRGTVSRELERLVSAGLLLLTRVGNQRHYQANKRCPIYHELSGVVQKTFGISAILREALSRLSDQLEWVFIFGAVANGKKSSTSDIDVMLIGDVGFPYVVTALYPVKERLGREINPKLFYKDEWLRMIENGDAFVKEVLSNPRMDVMGQANEFGKFDPDNVTEN